MQQKFELIGKEDMFPRPYDPRLRIFDFDELFMRLMQVGPNLPVFIDVDRFMIEDVPYGFGDLPRISFPLDYSREFIQFQIDLPSIVYVAFNPQFFLAPEGFVWSQERISVVEKVYDGNDRSRFTLVSVQYMIYERAYPAGIVYIRMVRRAITPFFVMIFIKKDTLKIKYEALQSCAGKPEVLSAVTVDFVACSSNCDGSGRDCKAAFPNMDKDIVPDAMWQACGKEEDYLTISWKANRQFFCFYFVPPYEQDQLIRQLSFEFSDGSQQLIPIANSKDTQKICFQKPVISNYVKVVFK